MTRSTRTRGIVGRPTSPKPSKALAARLATTPGLAQLRDAAYAAHGASIRFTAAEIVQLQRAARMVWNAIGHDCVDANGGREPGRAHIAELVCDADRLAQHVRRNIGRDLADKVDAAGPQLERIVAKAF